MSLLYSDLKVPTSAYNLDTPTTLTISGTTVSRATMAGTVASTPPLTGQQIHDNFLVVAYGVKAVETRATALEALGQVTGAAATGYLKYNGLVDLDGAMFGGSPWSVTGSVAITGGALTVASALSTQVQVNGGTVLATLYLPAATYSSTANYISSIWLKGSSVSVTDANTFTMTGTVNLSGVTKTAGWTFTVSVNGGVATTVTVTLSSGSGATNIASDIQSAITAAGAGVSSYLSCAASTNFIKFTGAGGAYTVSIAGTGTIQTVINGIAGPWNLWDLSSRITFSNPSANYVAISGYATVSSNFIFTKPGSNDLMTAIGTVAGMGFVGNVTPTIYHTVRLVSSSTNLNFKANLYAPSITTNTLTISSLAITGGLAVTGNVVVTGAISATTDISASGNVTVGASVSTTTQVTGLFKVKYPGFNNIISADASGNLIVVDIYAAATYGSFIVQPGYWGALPSLSVDAAGTLNVGSIGGVPAMTVNGAGLLKTKNIQVLSATPLAGTSCLFLATSYAGAGWAGSSDILGYSGGIKANTLASVSNATFGGVTTLGGGLVAATLGTATTGTTLIVDGSGNIRPTSSDIRLKKNIQPINYGLKDLLNIRGVTFNWKDPTEGQETLRNLGFIAQEVREIFPEVVFGDESKEMLSINATYLIPVIVEAIKTLNNKIEELKSLQ